MLMATTHSGLRHCLGLQSFQSIADKASTNGSRLLNINYLRTYGLRARQCNRCQNEWPPVSINSTATADKSKSRRAVRISRCRNVNGIDTCTEPVDKFVRCSSYEIIQVQQAVSVTEVETGSAETTADIAEFVDTFSLSECLCSCYRSESRPKVISKGFVISSSRISLTNKTGGVVEAADPRPSFNGKR